MPPLRAHGVNQRQSVIPAKSLVTQHRAHLQKHWSSRNVFLAIGSEGSLVRGRLDGLRGTSKFYIWSCQNPEISGGMSWYLIRKLM